MKKRWQIFLMCCLVETMSCSPQTQKDDSKKIKKVGTIVQDEVTYSTISSTSSTTQRLTADSSTSIAGTTIDFPPGSLAISTEISIQEGASLSSETSTLSSLGIGSGAIESSGVAVFINSTEPKDPVSPYQLSILLPDSASLSLAATDSNYVILYKVIKYSEEAKTFMGLIPSSEFTISKGKIVFKANYFGCFQAIKTNVKIAEVTEVASSEPIISKSEQTVLSFGEIGAIAPKLLPGKTYYFKVELLDSNNELKAASSVTRFTTK